jgi:carboxyl-terminal processing protease
MLPRTSWLLPGTFESLVLPMRAFIAIVLAFPVILGSAPAREEKPGQDSSPGKSEAEASSVGPAVESALGLADSGEGAGLWTAMRKLESLGKSAEPALRSKLLRSSERGQLACARVLLGSEDEDSKAEAHAALENLARSAGSKEVKIAAIDILGHHGDPEKVLPPLQALFDTTVDPALAIPLARALWDIDRVAGARDKLVDLLGSKDPEVKQEAALALAEMGYFEGEVRDVLRSLKAIPSPKGRYAAVLDRLARLSRELERGEALPEGTDLSKLLKIKESRIQELEEKLDRTGSPAEEPVSRSPVDLLLEEVILQIQKSYVDEAKTDRKRLILSSLKGMVEGLDEFSSFMDVEDTKAFRQSISGEYLGIGAQVNKLPDGPLEVVRPIYGGPAYKAGILSGDRILEVDGIQTEPLPVDEIIEKLKGPADSKVKLEVFRRGWAEPKEIVVERRTVEVPSVYHEMLPGHIGYVLIQQFGEKSAEEFIGALDELEKEGMGGLVLDVRNDPGGLLDAAVRVVDQFVKGDLPIVTQKGRGKKDKSQEVSTFPDPAARPNYPMVVLVNQRSASASEIVSGALQDFGRATLIGKRTFGKGSVQRLIPLSSEAQKVLGGESQLRLTVQYYFLPLGRCIHTLRDENGVVTHEGGVAPDIEVEQDMVPGWRLEERERLRTDARILDYIDKHADSLVQSLAESDEHDISRYPGFEELYKAVETPAPRDDLRIVLRFHLRRRLEDTTGREFACDVQEDLQLQAAILAILEKMGERPADYPRYARLAPKVKALQKDKRGEPEAEPEPPKEP